MENLEQGKKKQTRHFFIIVFLVAVAMLIVSSLLGEIIMTPLARNLDDGWVFLMEYASFISFWIVVPAYCFFWDKELLPVFRPGRGNTLKNLLIGLGIGLGMNLTCTLAAIAHGDIVLYYSQFDALYLIVGILAVMIQSGGEELVTRGYMLGATRERHGTVFAIAFNSLFFAAAHLMNPGVTALSIANIILVGVLCSLLVVFYDSLWMPIGLHTAWNYCQSLLLGLPNSGIVSAKALCKLDAATDSFFYSAAFGLEGSAFAAILESACIALVLYLNRDKLKKSEDLQPSS